MKAIHIHTDKPTSTVVVPLVFIFLLLMWYSVVSAASGAVSPSEAANQQAGGSMEGAGQTDIGGTLKSPCVEQDGRPECQVRSRGLLSVSVRIKNLQFDGCLTAEGPTSGSPIVLRPCRFDRGGYLSEWVLTPKYKNGRYWRRHWVNPSTGRCMQLEGVKFFLRPCKNIPTQQFFLYGVIRKGNFALTTLNVAGKVEIEGVRKPQYCMDANNNGLVRMRGPFNCLEGVAKETVWTTISSPDPRR